MLLIYIYILNRSGPSFDPYGTPKVMFFCRLNLLFSPAHCKRWLKLLRREVLENPYASSFAISRSWFRVSSAFEKSMKIASTKLPLSETFFHFSSIFNRQCCVLWFLQNLIKRLVKNGSMYSLI